MIKAKLSTLVAVTLMVAAFAALTPTAQACGGEYPAAIGGDTGQGVSYCSDGTFGGLGVPATESTDVDCGGEYPIYAEADTGQGVVYCSDGTISPFLGLLP